MAYERSNVLDRVGSLECVGVTVEVAPLKVERIGPQVGEVVFVQLQTSRRDWKCGEATVANYLSGDPLADFIDTGGCAQQAYIGVCVNIDKPGRQHEASSINFLVSATGCRQRAYSDNSAITNSDISSAKRPIGAIHHIGISEDKVEVHWESYEEFGRTIRSRPGLKPRRDKFPVQIPGASTSITSRAKSS
jgi:hypothetical protein